MRGSAAGSEPAGNIKDRLLAALTPFGQQHLVAFWDDLDRSQQGRLADEIERIDFGLIDKLVHSQAAHENWADLARRAEPPPSFRLHGGASSFSHDEAVAAGRQALDRGEVGVILVAGGQGTRLGFDHPKGMYPVGPISKASLFQILIEKIIARSRRHGVEIPLYLMTSPATHDETVEYLDAHGRFGLQEDQLRIFCQGTMPAVDAATGRVLLADRHQIALGPDGHGGMLAALARSGSLKEIRERGIKHLYYLQVDNPIISMCDPAFLGYHVLAESELSMQAIAKRSLRDKLGNVVLIDGKLCILEYSDLNPLPDEILNRKAADGGPVFWAGSIGVHVFDVGFLERMAADAEALPFHIARKAVPHVDAKGKPVEPREPNAIKFERFIFDLLPSARHGIVVEVDGEQAFAAVKNAPGADTDSPEIMHRQMINLHRQWLEHAGAKVAEGVAVEISPLLAQDAEELEQRIEPGREVTQPTYFQ